MSKFVHQFGGLRNMAMMSTGLLIAWQAAFSVRDGIDETSIAFAAITPIWFCLIGRDRQHNRAPEADFFRPADIIPGNETEGASVNGSGPLWQIMRRTERFFAQSLLGIQAILLILDATPQHALLNGFLSIILLLTLAIDQTRELLEQRTKKIGITQNDGAKRQFEHNRR